jgi:hypothetical protein
MFKYFVVWATQKWQTFRSKYVFFKPANYIRFYHFYVAHNTKKKLLRFYMLIGYTINYVQIF